jgi:hypothetical protein
MPLQPRSTVASLKVCGTTTVVSDPYCVTMWELNSSSSLQRGSVIPSSRGPMCLANAQVKLNVQCSASGARWERIVEKARARLYMTWNQRAC